MSKRGMKMNSANLTKMLFMIAALLVVVFLFTKVLKREGWTTTKPRPTAKFTMPKNYPTGIPKPPQHTTPVWKPT